MYIRPPKKLYISFSSLELSSEFVALHLPEMHDKTHKQITICNDDYKFIAYPPSILQKIAVKNMVMVMIHFESKV